MFSNDTPLLLKEFEENENWHKKTRVSREVSFDFNEIAGYESEIIINIKGLF